MLQYLRPRITPAIPTPPFEAYDAREREWEDEVYIRELSIVDGALGCAMWDGGVILTRFVHNNLSGAGFEGGGEGEEPM